jgi:peptidoglycan/xylan/chitin deacetylase (PgdA/CDA1 family)
VLLRPSLLVRRLLAPLLQGVIFRGDHQRRELAHTIDDGPSPGSDGSSRRTGSMALLALLRELQVPARLSSARFRQAFDQAASQLQSAAAPYTLPLRWFQPGGGWIRPSMLRNAHPGAILVLHDQPDTLPATMELLRLVVPALRQCGDRFVSLDRLLNA